MAELMLEVGENVFILSENSLFATLKVIFCTVFSVPMSFTFFQCGNYLKYKGCPLSQFMQCQSCKNGGRFKHTLRMFHGHGNYASHGHIFDANTVRGEGYVVGLGSCVAHFNQVWQCTGVEGENQMLCSYFFFFHFRFRFRPHWWRSDLRVLTFLVQSSVGSQFLRLRCGLHSEMGWI